jgi:hypothetical protein
MKKAIVFGVILSILWAQSCAGKKKECRAYLKTDNTATKSKAGSLHPKTNSK